MRIEPTRAKAGVFAGGFIELVSLAGAFPVGSTGIRWRTAVKWARGLPDDQREVHGGEIFVSREATLPHFQTVSDFLERGFRVDVLWPMERLPPGLGGWRNSDQERYLNTVVLVAEYWRTRHEVRHLSMRAFLTEFSRRWRAWARERGLGCTRHALERHCRAIDYRQPVTFTGNPERRGAPGRSKRRTSEAAWLLFSVYAGNPDVASLAEAWRLTAANAGRFGWRWCSLRTAQSRAREELARERICVKPSRRRRRRRGRKR